MEVVGGDMLVLRKSATASVIGSDWTCRQDNVKQLNG